MVRATSFATRSSWTRRLSLVWQPIWTPTAPEAIRGEILTRVRPFHPGWRVGPLAWWQLAATLGTSYVAHLDRWVWQTVQAQADPQTICHINLWPQTVAVAASWIADQPVTGLDLEVTEQLPWPPALWDTLHTVWIARGGAVWLDDWSDPDQVPTVAGLAGVKLDLHIWDGMTPAATDRWAAFVARCHEQGLAVIAEGIETVRQQDLALAWGCDGLQGFLRGRPEPWPRQEEGRP